MKLFRNFSRFAGAFLLALLVVTLPVYAQKSISGDDVCGGSSSQSCSISQIGTVTKGVFNILITLGLPLLVVSLAWRFIKAWFALRAGNAGAYKEALKDTMNAVVGFMIIAALLGGIFFGILKYFGVKDSYIAPWKKMFSVTLVEYAYAADGAGSPGQGITTASVQATSELNPTTITSLYDFILNTLRLIMRFFIYPGLIVMWVWTGFAFVMAQGAPDALTKAKKWLWWAILTTFAIFMLQAFLLAVRGSVTNITSKGTVTAGEIRSVDPTKVQPSTSVDVSAEADVVACKGRAEGAECSFEGKVTGGGTATKRGLCKTFDKVLACDYE